MKKFFIACLSMLLASLSNSAFSLGVGVDTVQTKSEVIQSATDIHMTRDNLAKKITEGKKLKELIQLVKNTYYVKQKIKDNKVLQAPAIIATSNFLTIKEGDDLSKLSDKDLLEKNLELETALSEIKLSEKELKDTLETEEREQEKNGKVAVDPKISAGEGDPTASINLRYTYKFEYNMFLTSAVDIGSISNDTADNLAAGFATNGGNIDFSLKYGYFVEFEGMDGVIRFTPTLSYTYSGVTASELDLEAGGITEVDTEVQSGTLGLTVSFGNQYFLALDHSYHDVSEKEITDFATLLDQKRTTVVRAIFAMDEDAKRLLVLERAHPIGNESAQLRLSFITSLAF